MAITVIGATGRVGSAVVQRLVRADTAVRMLVRNPGKAQRLFGDSPHLEIIRVHLDDPVAVPSPSGFSPSQAGGRVLAGGSDSSGEASFRGPLSAWVPGDLMDAKGAITGTLLPPRSGAWHHYVQGSDQSAQASNK